MPLPLVAESPGPTRDVLGQTETTQSALDDNTESQDNSGSNNEDLDPSMSPDASDGQESKTIIDLIQIVPKANGSVRQNSEGRLLLTTVTVWGGPSFYMSLPEAIYHYFSPNQVVMPTEAVYGFNRTSEEINQENQESMENSQDSAVTAALNFLGLTSDDYEIKVSLNDVGGPSAGLMFTLGILQKIGPMDLTKGSVIAGTGEISTDGVIGAIGGINQKIAGAKRDEAKLFLFPFDNCSAINRNSMAALPLYPVANINEAVQILENETFTSDLSSDEIYDQNLARLSKVCFIND
ncbi:MAG: hypothetical protein LBC43_02490 [Bifidobacteriaceae bacterium]|jgi:PDZ domain-containing protein|nr:hypothetical protein [Bifidobacteriaceae bacterium]